MKIGILTFHFNPNFGARLQCMALQKVLEQIGHNVEVINYRPVPETPLRFWRGWGLTSGNIASSVRQRWRLLRHGEAARERFRRFNQEHLRISPCCDSLPSIAKLASSFDVIIVGSDQVWNRSYFQDPAYFLDFAGYPGKRISYAACCGHLDMPQAGMESVRRALQAFNAISVRNEVTFEWVQKLSGLTPQIVCDPTLLYDFPELATPSIAPCHRYILAYVLDEEIKGGHVQAIEQIRQKFGDIPVIAVSPILMHLQAYPWADHVVFDVGPAEWVNLIANAAFVYTDSFHGALFSMKHQRPFLAYYSKPIRAGRLCDIANRYGIDSAIVGSLGEAEKKQSFCASLNYECIQKKISKHREESISFLQKSI
ncbi:MAG: polysaccharide pyruvyl transferase family protein [Verrucomicrobiota bacterium]